MTLLEQFEENVKGKNITVIGIGISNLPLIKYLVRLGANVKACDKRTEDELGDTYTELKNMNITFSLGKDYLTDIDADIIFRTPGMRFDNPYLLNAKDKGAKITSEMEVFLEICPSHIIAVTGSDGKTTTTTLIHKMMSEAGYKTWLGGNIGNPLLDMAKDMKKEDWVILELSSFQLHTMTKSPEISVITNLSPNHLDYHKDYQEYIDAKKNIYLHRDDAVLITNADNEDCVKNTKDFKGTFKTFSRHIEADSYLKNGTIMCGDTKVLDTADIKIPGMHNVENYMAAILAVSRLVDKDVILKVAREFGGVEHRIELVRVLNGVRYYNSSIDSSPNRTINTLNVFSDKVIMISGGKDKGIPYDEIGPAILKNVKTLILIGATADKIEEALIKADKGHNVEVIRVSAYEEAVNSAKSRATEGDVVLLSPASTSFDMFKNFEERGRLFKKLVNELEA